MKNILKKILGVHPEQLMITNVIDVDSSDPAIRLQEIRKRNLQLAVIKFHNSSILEYANEMSLNSFFVKSLFMPVTARVGRDITDTTARLIECRLRLKTGTLDVEVDPVFEQNYVPYIDIDNSFSNQYLTFATNKPTEYLNPDEFDAKKFLILDVSDLERALIPGGYIPKESGEVLINRNSSELITIIKGSKVLKFEGTCVTLFRDHQST